MNFHDCIQTAIDTGRITAKKGAEAHGAYQRSYERAAATMSPAEAELHAAQSAMNEITSVKAARRWQRINEMQRSHELYTRLMGAADPVREMEHIVQDLELSYETVQSIAMSNLDRLLLKYAPQKAGLVVPEAGLDDIAHAAFGEHAPAEAQEMAKSIGETMETLRQWANSYGAAIPENPNYRLPQMQDHVRVAAVQKDTWVNDHIDTLDWEVMRFGGQPIAVEDRAEVLGRTYDGIINDGFDREELAQGNRGTLVTKLNRDRFLYYKDADSYLAMMKKYGAGNLHQQVIGAIDGMAKDISILRVFGPSSDGGKEFAKRVALKRASDLNSAQPEGKRTALDKMKRQVALFDREYAIHARHVPTLDGNWAMNTFSTVRSLAVAAKLGGVFIPSLFGDLANMKAMARVFNLPAGGEIRRYLANFVGGDAERAEAIRGGVIFQQGISLAHSRQRYFSGLDGPHWARRVSDVTYRAGLAAHHTQVARNAAGKWFQGILADHAHMRFDDLPFAPMLVENGITPADWDAFRATPVYTHEGATFLRPVDAFKQDRRVAEKFSNAMQLYVRTAIPDTTLRQRAFVGEAIDPNSFSGQFARTTWSLASFPAAIYFNQLRRIAQTPGIRNKLVLGGQYALWTMLGGIMITQAKALVAGQQLYNMGLTNNDGSFNADFWGRAFANGGTFGILGDFIYNNINLSNSTYHPGTPTEEYLKKAKKLTIDDMIAAAQGKEPKVGKDAMTFIDANTPDLWYTKLLWQRAVSDQLFREADPVGWDRYQRYTREHEEGMWWGPDQGPEAIRPGTAIGQ